MSTSYTIKLPPLVILNGATASNILNSNEHYGDAAAIGILTPSGFTAGTMSFQVSHDGITFVTAQIGSTLADITFPAAGKAASYLSELIAYPYLRIKSSSAVGSDQTVQATKHYTATGM